MGSKVRRRHDHDLPLASKTVRDRYSVDAPELSQCVTVAKYEFRFRNVSVLLWIPAHGAVTVLYYMDIHSSI